MYAVIEASGKQFYVKKDMVIFIEKIAGKVGDKVTFDKVLLMEQKIGKPYIKTAQVTGVIEKQGQQKKLTILRHNHKSTHKRKYGHRQPYTRVKITEMKG